jgi:cytochrome bd ubiquinol oxidase subunit II
MDKVVIIYLWLSIMLYFLLGGADFGAGIIEMFTSSQRVRKTRSTLYHAIGPIWEANHMWLVIAIVILFVGFPSIYSSLSIHLHIPTLIMLMGIMARGTAFVFRHYDAVKDNMQKIYNKVFVWSSFITPLFLGIIAGATVSGKIDLHARSFADAYVFPWLNLFSIAVGFFTVALCGFLAAVYLIGEAENDYDRSEFIRKAKNANIIAVICGIGVYIAAEIDHVPLVRWIFGDRIGLGAVFAATISLVIMWLLIRAKRYFIVRPLVAFQVMMILLAISFEHFPDIVITRSGENFSLLRHQAGTATMQALGGALLIGSIFILPALFYLYYSFKKPADTGDYAQDPH